eukprot:5555518-Amphidinium_carterae.1
MAANGNLVGGGGGYGSGPSYARASAPTVTTVTGPDYNRNGIPDYLEQGGVYLAGTGLQAGGLQGGYYGAGGPGATVTT